MSGLVDYWRRLSFPRLVWPSQRPRYRSTSCLWSGVMC